MENIFNKITMPHLDLLKDISGYLYFHLEDNDENFFILTSDLRHTLITNINGVYI
jgi:hypothetical protein